MKFSLPNHTLDLINHYQNLKIGPYVLPCPYYQNISKIKHKAVRVGKGLPDEIEQEVINLFSTLEKRLEWYDPDSIRLYMVMAGLGIDCSGFVSRILESLLREKNLGKINKHIKPKSRSLSNLLRHNLKTFKNISADMLTSKKNCVEIKKIDNIIPSDLIRFGKYHVAIISEVEKNSGQVKTITYHHSTSDYFEQHGVRKGTIIIKNPARDLLHQEWTETYRGKNWTLEDYKKSPKTERGIRRLRTFVNK